ncbi:MAG: hypothetical protein N3F09_04670 [Bacteroidia bacterium]|nr:hypothetical protein [Bacteroidia bacterium]
MEFFLLLLLMAFCGGIGWMLAKVLNLNGKVWFWICFFFMIYGIGAEIIYFLIKKLIGFSTSAGETQTTEEKPKGGICGTLALGCVLVVTIIFMAILFLVIGIDIYLMVLSRDTHLILKNLNELIDKINNKVP